MPYYRTNPYEGAITGIQQLGQTVGNISDRYIKERELELEEQRQKQSMESGLATLKSQQQLNELQETGRQRSEALGRRFDREKFGHQQTLDWMNYFNQKKARGEEQQYRTEALKLQGRGISLQEQEQQYFTPEQFVSKFVPEVQREPMSKRLHALTAGNVSFIGTPDTYGRMMAESANVSDEELLMKNLKTSTIEMDNVLENVPVDKNNFIAWNNEMSKIYPGKELSVLPTINVTWVIPSGPDGKITKESPRSSAMFYIPTKEIMGGKSIVAIQKEYEKQAIKNFTPEEIANGAQVMSQVSFDAVPFYERERIFKDIRKEIVTKYSATAAVNKVFTADEAPVQIDMWYEEAEKSDVDPEEYIQTKLYETANAARGNWMGDTGNVQQQTQQQPQQSPIDISIGGTFNRAVVAPYKKISPLVSPFVTTPYQPY